MGYLQHKYTKSYFLKKDSAGNPTKFGVEGIDYFNKGDIRVPDKKILSRLIFKHRAVLDIGFGRGEAIKYALDGGAREVVGVDFSSDACVIAKEYLRRHNLSAQIICDDILNYIQTISGEKKGWFDYVFLLDVVEHIPRSELKEILIKLPNVLSHNSIVCINTPVFDIDNDVIKDGLKELARDTGDEFEETQGMHCNRYTQESLRSFMETCGFRSLSGHYYVLQGSFPKLYADALPIMWALAWLKKFPVKISSIFQREMYEHANPKNNRSFKGSLISFIKLVLPSFVVNIIKKIIDGRTRHFRT